MSWEYARPGLVCHAGHAIEADALVRRGDKATHVVWCVQHASERLHEDPPTDITRRLKPAGKLAMPESLRRKAEGFAKVLDWRDKAAGELE